MLASVLSIKLLIITFIISTYEIAYQKTLKHDWEHSFYPVTLLVLEALQIDRLIGYGLKMLKWKKTLCQNKFV